jgi:hypothetical protein
MLVLVDGVDAMRAFDSLAREQLHSLRFKPVCQLPSVGKLPGAVAAQHSTHSTSTNQYGRSTYSCLLNLSVPLNTSTKWTPVTRFTSHPSGTPYKAGERSMRTNRYV